jgi:23S rRNA (adenine1618-N6)-methyltransferase
MPEFVKKEHAAEKTRLHERSAHRERYNFAPLIACHPVLANFVCKNKYDDNSIDFADAAAITALNTAILKHNYNIKFYNIPTGYLTAPVPGRADYMHYVADILASSNNGVIPKGKKVHCLDIGIGANCIYPLIGNAAYGWRFVGSDIDAVSIDNAENIIAENNLQELIECRLQPNEKNIFFGVVRKNEYFDITFCNPPFHASQEDAQAGTLRKLNNLNKVQTSKPTLNFGGKSNELWCEGGEKAFTKNLVDQSKQFAEGCLWFSTLISKEANVKRVQDALQRLGAADVRTIPMGQGNKSSRIIAWTFQNKEQHEKWANKYWAK